MRQKLRAMYGVAREEKKMADSFRMEEEIRTALLWEEKRTYKDRIFGKGSTRGKKNFSKS